jgi:calcineurin-like phosphoesterase family protein
MYYSPLLIKNDDTNVLFWSDTHFGHKCERWDVPLWRQRGFNSVDEHDQILIERWNSKAQEDTIGFFLGDFIFGPDTIRRFEEIVNNMKFKTLHMMPGNHCSGWKQHLEKNASTHGVWNISDSKRLIFIPNYLEAVVNKQPIVMSHYPIVSFNGQTKGSWMIHGHCHGKLYQSPTAQFIYQAKVLDVGIENSPHPKTFGDIKKYFADKENVSFESP